MSRSILCSFPHPLFHIDAFRGDWCGCFHSPEHFATTILQTSASLGIQEPSAKIAEDT